MTCDAFANSLSVRASSRNAATDTSPRSLNVSWAQRSREVIHAGTRHHVSSGSST